MIKRIAPFSAKNLLEFFIGGFRLWRAWLRMHVFGRIQWIQWKSIGSSKHISLPKRCILCFMKQHPVQSGKHFIIIQELLYNSSPFICCKMLSR